MSVEIRKDRKGMKGKLTEKPQPITQQPVL